jgi:hypothetical protein
MSLHRIVTNILRRTPKPLEIVGAVRVNGNLLIYRDLLDRIYILDDSIEITGGRGTELSIKQSKNLVVKEISDDVYRFSDRNFEVLIRPAQK